MTHGQTDEQTDTDRQTQTDFIICPILYAIAMGQIKVRLGYNWATINTVACQGKATGP